MARRFISQFGERETIHEVFLAADKQLRANRNGNLYLQVRLSDRTGSLTAMMWNANEDVYSRFDDGDYVRVQGVTQFYNGALQMIVSRIERADPAEVDEADFVALADPQREELLERLTRLLRSLADPHLRNVAECFLVDESFLQDFAQAPAGVKNHHAYPGGLLEHTVSLMEMADAAAAHYPDLNRDLLLLGAFLHDAGKTRELSCHRGLAYTDEGQLLGHMVLAVEMLDAKAKEAERLGGEPLPAEPLLRLKHMIVSHHGQLEYGSPTVPMTPEAIALHFLDNLDAKLHAVADVIRRDVNADSNWTPYQSALGRKLFKGAGS